MTRLRPSKIAVPLIFAFHAVIVFTLVRSLLVLASWKSFPHSLFFILNVMVTGFKMDLVMTALLSLPLFLYLTVVPERFFENKWHLWMLEGIYIGALFVFVFLNVADFYFFDEFNSRFNYIAIDYLFATPREVVGNVWQSYPVPFVIILVGTFVFVLHRSTRQYFFKWISSPTPMAHRLIALLLAITVSVGGLKLLDIKMLNNNPNRVAAEVGANGFYTLGYALLTNNMSYENYYQTLNEGEAFDRVIKRVQSNRDHFLNDAENKLRRTVAAKSGLKNPNVVIILEESLGAEFSTKLRQHPNNLTPNLDALMTKSHVFNRFYSTGTRTIRALEAVVASFPPIPGASIVKRANSHNVATIARILERNNYETVFIYGGRGVFDNMRRFALDNGYHRFIEQKDFKKPTFTTIWGVCDEDIFSKALETFDEMASHSKPFFATILSVSNHRPYTYPKGRIDLDPEDHERNHAVKYADYALGDFFRKAESHRFFKNTLFVILGDHGARVYGADFIPIHSYEIPLLFYAPGLLPKPIVHETLGCSLDVAPTILGLLGLSYASTFYGRDLFSLDPKTAYVLLQHDRDVGLFTGEKLAVLSTRKTANVFNYRSLDKGFDIVNPITPVDQELIHDAAAFYQTGYDLYADGLYTAD